MTVSTMADSIIVICFTACVLLGTGGTVKELIDEIRKDKKKQA